MSETIKTESDIEITCATCGNDLETSTDEDRRGHATTAIKVEPCATCMEAAKDEAIEKSEAEE